MEATRAEKARLGIFVAIALGVVGISLFFIVGKKLLTGWDHYKTKISESVGGLEPGSSVKLNGVVVGQIEAIIPDTTKPNTSIVEFRVKEGTPIKEDMKAHLASFGITGLKYLEITGGSFASKPLEEGEFIPSEPSTMGKLTQRAESIAGQFDTLLSNIVSFTAPQNQANAGQLMENLVSLSATLDTFVTDINRIQPGQKLELMMDEFLVAATQLRTKISETDIEGAVTEFERAGSKVSEVAEKLNLNMIRIQDDMTQSMVNLRETMENMNDFSRQIKDNPSILLRGENKQQRKF